MARREKEKKGYYYKVTNDMNALLLVTPLRLNAVLFIRQALNDYGVQIYKNRLVKGQYRMSRFKPEQNNEEFIVNEPAFDLQLVNGKKDPDCIGFWYGKTEEIK